MPAALLLSLAVPVAGRSGGQETAAQREAAERKAEEAQQPSRIVRVKIFRSPSGNIGCALNDGGARCDIRKRDWSPPPRPAKCPEQVDYGQGVEVDHRDQADFVCAGDTALDPSSSALVYGTASEVGGSDFLRAWVLPVRRRARRPAGDRT